MNRFLPKPFDRDKVPLSVSVGDRKVYTLLEELCLLQKFNVRFTGGVQADQ